jgi:hypothetical protein
MSLQQTTLLKELPYQLSEMIEKLDESNALLYAAKHYTNPHCYDTVEFYEDLNRFKYVKRLLNKYEESGDLRDRLIFNHLTVIYNVFGADAGTRLLFLKLQNQLHLIKPFLLIMGTLPDVVENIGIQGKNYYSSNIPMDPDVVRQLRNIDGN